MPKLDIDMFDQEPKVGDHVRVKGKIESINEDTGEVEVSYDDVSIIDKDKVKKHKKSRDYGDEEVVLEDQMAPNTQSLDQALGEAFPNTQ